MRVRIYRREHFPPGRRYWDSSYSLNAAKREAAVIRRSFPYQRNWGAFQVSQDTSNWILYVEE